VQFILAEFRNVFMKAFPIQHKSCTVLCGLDCVPQSLYLAAYRYINTKVRKALDVASDSKGGIDTCASTRYEFGLRALSSHAASQSRPSTISGVREVREGGIITAMNVGWVSPMDATFLTVISKSCCRS
jgi:hypothetical protein